MQTIEQPRRLKQANDYEIAPQMWPTLLQVEDSKCEERAEHDIYTSQQEEQAAPAREQTIYAGVPNSEHERSRERSDHCRNQQMPRSRSYALTEGEASKHKLNCGKVAALVTVAGSTQAASLIVWTSAKV